MKLFRIALFATLLSVGIASCGGSNDDPINNVTPTPTPSNTTVKVESVAVSSATISLKEGESQTITVTITPTNATDKKYTFSSSDKDVATVDDTGKITALKAGEATITVTTSDGNKTATCKVTVTSNAPVLNKKMVRWYRYKDGSQDKKGGFSYDSEDFTVIVRVQAYIHLNMKRIESLLIIVMKVGGNNFCTISQKIE